MLLETTPLDQQQHKPLLLPRRAPAPSSFTLFHHINYNSLASSSRILSMSSGDGGQTNTVNNNASGAISSAVAHSSVPASAEAAPARKGGAEHQRNPVDDDRKQQKNSSSAGAAASSEETAASAASPAATMERPHRPLNAYNIFFAAERQRLLQALPERAAPLKKPKSSHGKMGFADMARSVSKRWKSLDPSEKSYYLQLAEQEKQKYYVEMDKWYQAIHKDDDDDDHVDAEETHKDSALKQQAASTDTGASSSGPATGPTSIAKKPAATTVHEVVLLQKQEDSIEHSSAASRRRTVAPTPSVPALAPPGMPTIPTIDFNHLVNQRLQALLGTAADVGSSSSHQQEATLPDGFSRIAAMGGSHLLSLAQRQQQHESETTRNAVPMEGVAPPSLAISNQQLIAMAGAGAPSLGFLPTFFQPLEEIDASGSGRGNSARGSAFAQQQQSSQGDSEMEESKTPHASDLAVPMEHQEEQARQQEQDPQNQSLTIQAGIANLHRASQHVTQGWDDNRNTLLSMQSALASQQVLWLQQLQQQQQTSIQAAAPGPAAPMSSAQVIAEQKLSNESPNAGRETLPSTAIESTVMSPAAESLITAGGQLDVEETLMLPQQQEPQDPPPSQMPHHTLPTVRQPSTTEDQSNIGHEGTYNYLACDLGNEAVDFLIDAFGQQHPILPGAPFPPPAPDQNQQQGTNFGGPSPHYDASPF
mmetsp:Transcript_28520/g.59552  ORF Transcript_28520/g.59552 Transcript_28520/m.59552 type:complete len:704 (-) Transcript_28520:138-2249(-)